MDISRETRIKLNDFTPRFYQSIILDAWENKGKKKILFVLPRRSGKDYLAWQMAIRQCIRKTCLVLYALPTYGQALRCVWDAIAIDGVRFLDLIPKEIVQSTNRSEMSITFTNGSKLKLIGADSYDTSLVGTNAQMIILSEAALMQLESVYSYARPILAANGGTVVIFGTPRGKNAFWQLYRSALELPDWSVIRMGVDQTQHVPIEVLNEERRQMSPELFEQEWMCSFDKGVDGQIYGRELESARLQERIGFFPHDPTYPVYIAMDIGVNKNNATALIWFQLPNRGEGSIKIIDAWSAEGVGAPKVVEMVNSKPYKLGKFFAPHDAAVREWGGGAISRIEKLHQLGLKVEVLAKPNSVEDGIDNVKAMFNRIYINEPNCGGLIRALEQYHREYDEVKQIYAPKAVHDWSSNYCFSADTNILTSNGTCQIIDKLSSDAAITLKGEQCSSKAMKTRKSASLVEVRFVDGTQVKCTPDHLFLTEKGWKSAQHLMNSLEIQSNWTKLPNTLMDIYIEFMAMFPIFQDLANSCTEWYGSMLLERYQQAVSYITSILTLKTTTYGILNVCQKKNIEEYQNQIIKEYQINAVQLQQDGTLQLKGDYSISDLLNELKIGLNGKLNLVTAFGVIENLKLLFEKADANTNSVITIAKPAIIESIKRLDKKEDVYCLNVPSVGHFALSNGAIVKNCDALRYVCQAIHLCTPTANVSHLYRQRDEALYGSRYGGVFGQRGVYTR